MVNMTDDAQRARVEAEVEHYKLIKATAAMRALRSAHDADFSAGFEAGYKAAMEEKPTHAARELGSLKPLCTIIPQVTEFLKDVDCPDCKIILKAMGAIE